MELRLSEVARWTAGRLHGADTKVDGAGIDSRSLKPGQLFVALVAERDGHDFTDAALRAGASGCLVSRPRGGVSIPDGVGFVEVDDTTAALQALGRGVRSTMNGEVIGVTGSVGKTSTKDLLAAILATTAPTYASERSFNNEIGVPLTLLNAPREASFVVVEMGARGRGHIELLCNIAHPTMGIVTAVAEVHTELFGSLDDVAAAKAELIEALPPTGVAVLNIDDERVRAMATRAVAPLCRVASAASTLGEAEVVYEVLAVGPDLRPRVRLSVAGESVEFVLGVAGAHQATNAALAAGAAHSLGVGLDAIVAGLAGAQLSPWRMAVERAPGGLVVINDAYNASPKSMCAAIDALCAVPVANRVALLGQMAELGDDGAALHRQVAAYAAERGVIVVAVDTANYGVESHTADSALARVRALGPDTAVLVKASRVAGFERLAGELLAE